MFGKKSMSPFAKVSGMMAPILLTLTLGTTVVGVAFPYWIKFQETDYGIFEICKPDISNCTSSISALETSHPGSVTMWRVMMSLAVVGSFFLFLAEFLICLFPCMQTVTDGKMALGVAICFTCFLGAALMVSVVGIMLGLAMTDIVPYLATEYMGWPLYLTGSGGLLGLVTGILFSIHLFALAYY